MAIGLKRKQKSAFEKMAFNESVADPVYENIASLYEDVESRGAIVKNNENYLILALLDKEVEETLGKKGLKSEEAGTFASNINNDVIEHVSVEADLYNGILGIIPTSETLGELFELDFMSRVPIHIAVVTPDFNEEDGLEVYDSTVSINDLINVRNGHSTIIIEDDNAKVVDIDDQQESPSIESDRQPVEDVSHETSVDDFEPVMDEQGFEPVDHSEGPVREEQQYEVSPQEFASVEEEQYQDFPQSEEGYREEETVQDEYVNPFDNLPQHSTYDDNVLYQEQPQQMISAEDILKIQDKINEEMQSDQLQMVVDSSDFDQLFNNADHPIELFNETVNDPNSALDTHVAQLSSAANTRLLRHYDQSMGILRSEYVLSLKKFADKVHASLDYHKEGTSSFNKAAEIEKEVDESQEFALVELNEQRAEIQRQYDEARLRAGEEARIKAENAYDREHREELKRDLNTGTDKIEMDAAKLRMDKMNDLHKHRRDLAQSALERAKTEMLMVYQERIDQLQREQRMMFNEELDKIETFVEKNYSGEIMRAAAIREELNRGNDIKSLEMRYEALAEAKEAELRAANEKAQAELNVAAEKAQLDITNLRSDFEKQINFERELNKQLRASLDDTTRKFVELDEKKDDEYRHRLKVSEDRVEALQARADQRDKDYVQGNRNRWIMTGLLSLIILVLSVGGTYVFMKTTLNDSSAAKQEQVSELERKLENAQNKVDDYEQVSETQKTQIDALNKTIQDLVDANKSDTKPETTTPSSSTD